MPTLEYASGAILRKVASTGHITWHCDRLLVGRGLTGEWIQMEPTDHKLIVRYGPHEIRRLDRTELAVRGILSAPPTSLQNVSPMSLH